MVHHTCLNCGKKVTDNYCSGCGQKTDTHRISLKNFIFHDVLHGTFHIEKGMLFTAKQALVRPGKAALEYIAGKRVAYYNVFYLILIVVGLMLFFRHFYEQLDRDNTSIIHETKHYINEASKKFDLLITQKSKLIIFLFVPFGALNSLLLFRRKKLNLSEHAILSGMILLGILLISLMAHILFYFNLIVEGDIVAKIIDYSSPTLIVFYVGYAYYNAFSTDYSKFGIASRVLLFYGLLFLEAYCLFLIAFGFITDWKFGTISFSL